jgi:hypothetical protein
LADGNIGNFRYALLFSASHFYSRHRLVAWFCVLNQQQVWSSPSRNCPSSLRHPILWRGFGFWVWVYLSSFSSIKFFTNFPILNGKSVTFHRSWLGTSELWLAWFWYLSVANLYLVLNLWVWLNLSFFSSNKFFIHFPISNVQSVTLHRSCRG